MAEEVEDLQPLPRRRPVRPEPAARELLKAADLIRGALNPVALAGNGVTRGGASPALREFVRATGIPVAETFMGKGVLDSRDSKRWWRGRNSYCFHKKPGQSAGLFCFNGCAPPQANDSY